jgi:hypothetical protein
MAVVVEGYQRLYGGRGLSERAARLKERFVRHSIAPKYWMQFFVLKTNGTHEHIEPKTIYTMIH